MGYETINSGDMPDKLNEAWPLDGDPMGAGAIHLRGLKTVVKNSHKSTLTQSALMMEMQQAFNNQEFEASGFVHMGKHFGTAGVYTSINQGLWVGGSDENFLRWGLWNNLPAGADSTSETYLPVVNIAGIKTEISLHNISDNGSRPDSRIKFPQAEDGKRTFDTATGTSVVHAGVAEAFAAETATNEVVTDRVDTWGVEQWKEEITAAHPMMYGNGLPQSLATTVDGIATEVDNTRPITYFAQFKGDTTSRGRGINTATTGFANLAKLMSNPDNKMYYTADSKLEQIRNRIRTFAGAGNGDWFSIDVAKSPTQGSRLAFAGSAKVVPQGAQDSVAEYTPSGNNTFTTPEYNSQAPSRNTKGIYHTYAAPSAVAVDYECYFLVCGTVNRLNQGAHHPALNAKGAGKWRVSVGSPGANYWYSSVVKVPMTSRQDAFLYGIYGDIVNTKNGAGRPEGRFYDGICAGGQGGVCRDMRYSARKLTLEDYAEADLRVKAGVYRGFEKEVFTETRAYGDGYTIGNGSAGGLIGDTWFLKINASVDDWAGPNPSHNYKQFEGYVVADDGSVAPVEAIYNSGGLQTVVVKKTEYPTNPYLTWQYKTGLHIVRTSDLPTSVGGEFLQTDVIGSPANLKVAFPQGFAGRWMGDFDGNSASTFEFTRKSLDTSSNGVNSSDAGGTWEASTPVISSATNDSTFGAHNKVGRVGVYPYTAFAKQTKPSVNAKVLGGLKGMLPVFACSHTSVNYGSLLCESLAGVIPTSASSYICGHAEIKTYGLFTEGKLHTAGTLLPTHGDFTANGAGGRPGDKGAKAMGLLMSSDGMGSINYAYRELVYGSSDWGDDGLVRVNAGVRPDLNGTDTKYGLAALAEPIGWA